MSLGFDSVLRDEQAKYMDTKLGVKVNFRALPRKMQKKLSNPFLENKLTSSKIEHLIAEFKRNNILSSHAQF